MPEPRHLRSAPITEAIIDARVKARASFNPSAFVGIHAQIADRFPVKEERKGGQVTFRVGSTGPTEPEFQDLGTQGFFFKSPDERLIAQFRNDGFTLNRLKPYTSWEDLFPIALDLWNLYVATAAPEAVTRIGLRYINHIMLPDGVIELNDYLRAVPPIPEELPQFLGPFQSRLTIHDPDAGCAAHVAQSFEPGHHGRGPTLLLDIDAFREVDMVPGDPEVVATITHLHDFKNKIFFSMVTEDTLRAYI